MLVYKCNNKKNRTKVYGLGIGGEKRKSCVRCGTHRSTSPDKRRKGEKGLINDNRSYNTQKKKNTLKKPFRYMFARRRGPCFGFLVKFPPLYPLSPPTPHNDICKKWKRNVRDGLNSRVVQIYKKIICFVKYFFLCLWTLFCVSEISIWADTFSSHLYVGEPQSILKVRCDIVVFE